MPFFDTHTHLDYLQQFTGEPLSQLIDNAKQANVQKILIVAVKEADFKTIQNMTALFPSNLYYGLGLHPLYIKEHAENDLMLLEQALKNRDTNCTAVAEIGLERAFLICSPMNFGQNNVIFLKANFIWQSNLIYPSIFTVEKPMIKFLLF